MPPGTTRYAGARKFFDLAHALPVVAVDRARLEKFCLHLGIVSCISLR